MARTDSLDSFINIDPRQAPTTTHTLATNHRSSLAIANAKEVHNFQIQAREALDLLNTPAVCITNNVPTVQTIDQIIGVVSDQFQAQQLCVQHEIQEQVKSTNARFAALAEQMQQLISTTTAAANARNPPTPRLPPMSSWFQGKETRDIYIPNETLGETELAQVFGGPPIQVKPEAPSTDRLYNNEFSGTARAKKKHPVLHLKEASSQGQIPLVSRITRLTIITTTRILSTKCRAHLTAKKIVALKQLSTICTR
uniref:Uncharacterized protein n=1 Tax=Romanomermis culicivorax TaxID=13658 RepID=A0A915HU07_ROMCU